jgi:hypothetical protein
MEVHFSLVVVIRRADPDICHAKASGWPDRTLRARILQRLELAAGVGRLLDKTPSIRLTFLDYERKSALRCHYVTFVQSVNLIYAKVGPDEERIYELTSR